MDLQLLITQDGTSTFIDFWMMDFERPIEDLVFTATMTVPMLFDLLLSI